MHDHDLAPEATKHDFGTPWCSLHLSHDPPVPFSHGTRNLESRGTYAKPFGILNVMGIYSPLPRMFGCSGCSTMRGREERSLKTENRALVLARDQLADLLQALEEWRPAHIEKWLSRETRLIGRNASKGRSE
jgi:hypothetical protein